MISTVKHTGHPVGNPSMGNPSVGNPLMDSVSKAVLPVAIPVGLTALQYYMLFQNKDVLDWYGRLNTPSWFAKDASFIAPIDLITLGAGGYAAHLICKGVATSDRQVALTTYGAGLAVWFTGFVVYQKKDMRLWFAHMALSSGIFTATAFAFYNLNTNAGKLMAPLAAWLGYQALGFLGMVQANP